MDTTPDSSIESLLEHAAWVNGLARSLAGDAHAADDLAQDTWVAAIRNPPGDDRPPRSWLARVMRNFARRRVRTDARRRAREEFAARGENEPCSDEIVERAALHRDLVEAVMSLDEPYRSTILLRYFEELGPTAIATRQRVPVSTVKTRLARGLDALRAKLDRKHGDRSAWIAAIVPLAPRATSSSVLTGAVLVNLKILVAAAVVMALALIAAFIGRLPARGADPVVSSSSVANAGTRETMQDSLVRADERTKVSESGAEPATSAGAVDTWTVDTDQDLHGVVLDLRGAPLTNARVEVSRDELRGMRLVHEQGVKGQRIVASTITDAKGRFRIPLQRGRPFDLRVSLAGFATERFESRYAGEFLEVRMGVAAELHGRVTRQSDGSPCANANVFVRLREHRSLQDEDLETRTDSAGQYVLGSLPPEALLLGIDPTDAVPLHALGIRLEPGESRERNFVLEDGAIVSGLVTDRTTGEPIESAEVALSPGTNSRTTHTDSKGRWSLRGIERRTSTMITLLARASGYASYWKTELGRAEGEFTVDFALSRGGSARGRVIGPDGAPIADAYVGIDGTMVRDGQRSYDRTSTSTSADGRFEIKDLDRESPHTLFVCKDDMGSRLYDLPKDLATNGTVDFGDIRMGEAATLLGRVVDENGVPLPRLYVYLHGSNSDRGYFNDQEDYMSAVRATQREGRCDDRGRFGFTDISAGQYRLDVSPKGSASTAEFDVRIDAGEVREGIELVLTIGKSITGRVTDADGKPIDTATVTIYREPYDRNRTSYTVTDAEGGFRLTGLSEDASYELEFGDALVTSESGREQLYGGRLKGVRAGTSGILFAFQHAVEIRGSVVGLDGSPIPSFYVYAIEAERGQEDWPDATARTDASGHFTLRVGAAHIYNVMAATDVPSPSLEQGAHYWGSVSGVRSGDENVVIKLAKVR